MAKLKFALRGLLSVALLFWVARKISWTDLSLILGRIDWFWAALGFLLSGTLITGLAARWQIFLRQQRIELPFGTVLSLTWAGQFFNSFLPGSTGGDVFKIYQVCRITVGRKGAAVASVLIDRFIALLALLLFAGVGFILEPTPLREILGAKMPAPNSWWLAVVPALVFGAFWITWRTRVTRLWLGGLRQGLMAALQNVRPNAATGLLLALGIHSLNFLVLFFLARSLGLTISFGQILLMMPVVLLLLMLPITINGHGLREILFIAYFTHLGVHLRQDGAVGYQEVALSLSLLMVINDLLWSLPGGLQYLVRFRTSKDSHVLASAT